MAIKHFTLTGLFEKLCLGSTKMLKSGSSQVKAMAIDIISQFLMRRPQIKKEEAGALDQDNPRISRIENEQWNKLTDAEKLAQEKCFIQYFRVMSSDSDDLRLKAVQQLSLIASENAHNFDILLQRIKDKNFLVRQEMMHLFSRCKIYISRLGKEETFQLITYCMQTRDESKPKSPRNEIVVHRLSKSADMVQGRRFE